MNPLDLDFSAWTGPELRDYREELWISRDEMRRSPLRTRSYPSCVDMAARVGVSADQWRHWEREGVPSNGWSALLRIYREEEREILPLNCSIAALDSLGELLGSLSAVALALEVDRRTIGKWKYEIGYVPGVQGYGRIVRICFEDMCGP